MIRVLIITDDPESWVAKITEEVPKCERHDLQGTTLLHTDMFAFTIMTGLPVNVCGERCNQIILDRYVPDEICRVVLGPYLYGFWRTDNFFKQQPETI